MRFASFLSGGFITAIVKISKSPKCFAEFQENFSESTGKNWQNAPLCNVPVNWPVCYYHCTNECVFSEYVPTIKKIFFAFTLSKMHKLMLYLSS